MVLKIKDFLFCYCQSDDVIKKNLIDFGFGGWMADFGEYLPADAVYHDGSDPLKMHNKFPVV